MTQSWIRLRRSEREKRQDEAAYRRDVLRPSPTWQKHFKAAAKNGSPAELRQLVRELQSAIDRLDGFLKDPDYYGR